MNIVAMMWTYGEGDILEETIRDSLLHVDSLFIAEGGSKDRSWEIIQSLQKELPDKIEYTQCKPEQEKKDRGQRNALLNKIRERYRPEDTWTMVIESDTFVLDTNIRALVAGSDKIAISWNMLNACRLPGTWAEVDTYPNWQAPIRELMPFAHWMEIALPLFRPLPKLYFPSSPYKPRPVGWTHYTNEPLKRACRFPDAGLLLHVGFRGPKHCYEKYKKFGQFHPKYTDWEISSPEAADRTVAYLCEWNKNPFPATRAGWKQFLGVKE